LAFIIKIHHTALNYSEGRCLC